MWPSAPPTIVGWPDMPSPEVLAVLADEVVEVTPQLVNALARLAEEGGPDRAEAIELYREPVERIAGTAELLGLHGLQEFCTQLGKNLGVLDSGVLDEHLRSLLGRWPGLLIGYLRAPQDGVYSRELADYFRDDRWPDRMDAVQAMTLTEKLSAIADHDEEEEEANRRPVEAQPGDVDLSIAEDVNPALIDSFLAEAPLQAGAYTSIVENVIRGGAGPHTLNEARRLIHSIKGAANTVGVRGVAQLTHHLEDLLEYLAQHSITPQGAIAKLLMDAADCLEMMFETLVIYEPAPPQAQAVLQRLLDVANDIDRGVAVENIGAQPEEASAPAEPTADVFVAAGEEGDAAVISADEQPSDIDAAAHSEDTVSSSAVSTEEQEAEPEILDTVGEVDQNEPVGPEAPSVPASVVDPSDEIQPAEPLSAAKEDEKPADLEAADADAANDEPEVPEVPSMLASVMWLSDEGKPLEPLTTTLPEEKPADLKSADAITANDEPEVPEVASMLASVMGLLDDAQSTEPAIAEASDGEHEPVDSDPAEDATPVGAETTFAQLGEAEGSVQPPAVEAPLADETAPAQVSPSESAVAKDSDSEAPAAEVSTAKVSGSERSAARTPPPAPRAETKTESKTPVRQAPEVKRAIRVAADTIEELLRLSSEMTIGRSHIQERLHQAFSFTGELRERQSMLQTRSVELDRIVTVQGVAAGQKRGEAKPGGGIGGGIFDALELDQYSELHGAVHGIVETVADVQTIGTRVLDALEAIETAVTQQGLVNTELHEQIMRARMVPAANIEPRLARVVRQACDATGKQATLVFTGSDVMLDDHVVNEVINPLSHLLRNAVDHGIESPDVRLAAGKPAIGEIRLSFEREGNHIVIRCSDDGAGLDLTHIHGVAVQRGLVPEDVELNDTQIARLILLPGFSTRSQVSEVSGRGVGMDVVNVAMEKLKGTIDIASDLGAGCNFTLRLPLTMGSAHCLLVRSSGTMSAIPTDVLDRVVYTGARDIERLGKSWVYREDRDTIEAFDLADLLGYPVDQPFGNSEDSRPVIVVNGRDGKQAVVVDQLLAGRDLVIKSLGRYLGMARGIVGASLLGDGTVLPVLDMLQLLEREMGGIAVPGIQVAHRASVARSALTDILVVDDSLSVRQALSQLLEDEGYQVHTAKDGVEALEYLDNERPAAMLVDLEMPRMNGLELTQRLRERDNTRNLPVIMITSRTSEKHRTQAQLAGVDLYLTKPYREVDLLARLRSMLSKAA